MKHLKLSGSAIATSPLTAVVSRRGLIQGAAAAGVGLAMASLNANAAPMNRILAPAGTAFDLVDELTIDLSAELANLDPSMAYDVNAWSIIHSIYDSLVQYDAMGTLQPLAAESMTQLDPLTWEIKLRSGMTFHNGEPVDASSIGVSQAHIVNNKASDIAGNFQTISEVKVIDALTAHLVLSQPSAWLPAQIALWLVLLPPAHAASNDIARTPVGSGPYSFVEWKSGEQITLEANPTYFAGSPKGQPVAKRVIFRFVPEGSTRVADLLSGGAGIIRDLAVDQQQPVKDGEASVIVNPISGCSWIRVPTDVAPFSDVRVRQALNYAIDVPGIISALNGGYGAPLPNFFPEHGLGYSANLTPYSYDPEKAKALLAEAGVSNFETTLEYASSERSDVSEAIAAQLSDAGIKTTAKAVEVATFNGTWKDPNAAPLRYATWRPLFDPYSLLSLVVSKSGYLSRYDNPNAQTLLDAAASEPDPVKRAALYVQLGQVLHDEPAAIYLWSLTSLYGAAKTAPVFTPRPDDILIPAVQPS